MEMWQVMDLFAAEWFTDWFSILAGYIVFCVAVVSLGFPASVVVRFFRSTRTAAIAAVVLCSVVLFILSMFKVHELLNIYQAWYTAPLGQPLEL